MVRDSVTQLILFIAVVSVATLLAGTMVVEVGLYSQSIGDKGDRAAAAIDADVTIVNDPEAGATYDNRTETVTLYVKNVGGSTLEPADLDVLLDGTYVTPASREVLEGDYWRSGHTLAVTANHSLETGERRALVRIDGARNVLEFEHRIAYWLDPETGSGDEPAPDEYTVSLNEETLELTMDTDRTQADETVTYWVNDSTVATFSGSDTGSDNTTTTGTTDSVGQDSVTLDLHATGTVRVTLDIGWDEDEILIRVIDE
ncbi:flagellin [Halomontanus rarus]|uniref:flagellin n=1 Tax=Halomontanus rarus TaxID=3034020 RepID=UPI0023E8C075|nr:flagellin [Halovivax sp. TS33]